METKIEYYSNGKVYRITHNLNGVFHNDDGAAELIFTSGGSIKEVTFFRNGQVYRANGPAHIVYHPNGDKKMEVYFTGGQAHNRKDQPALREYYEGGKIKREEYYYKGNMHCNFGAAELNYGPDGFLKEEVYYRYGQLLSEAEFTEFLAKKNKADENKRAAAAKRAKRETIDRVAGGGGLCSE